MGEQKADEWLFEVEDVFNLSGPGFVVACDLEPSSAVLRVGDALTFLCPDGQEVETHIKSFTLVTLQRSKKLITIELVKSAEDTHITAGAQAFRRGAARG